MLPRATTLPTDSQKNLVEQFSKKKSEEEKKALLEKILGDKGSLEKAADVDDREPSQKIPKDKVPL